MFRNLIAAVATLALAACATATETSRALPGATPGTPEAIGIDMPEHFSDWLRGHYTERVYLFEEYQPMNGGVAFVGDSITEGGGDWSAGFPGVETRNFGIGGDTTVGLERRIAQIAAARPAKILLLIGTNDLGNEHKSPEAIVRDYALVLDRFARDLPETQVFVQAVLPREPENAEAVRQINQRLQALAAQRGLTFVDIYTPFAVEGGRLDPSVTEDDLHLTAAGYARWRSIIEPIVRS